MSGDQGGSPRLSHPLTKGGGFAIAAASGIGWILIDRMVESYTWALPLVATVFLLSLWVVLLGCVRKWTKLILISFWSISAVTLAIGSFFVGRASNPPPPIFAALDRPPLKYVCKTDVSKSPAQYAVLVEFGGRIELPDQHGLYVSVGLREGGVILETPQLWTGVPHRTEPQPRHHEQEISWFVNENGLSDMFKEGLSGGHYWMAINAPMIDRHRSLYMMVRSSKPIVVQDAILAEDWSVSEDAQRAFDLNATTSPCPW